jgi:hypothetical protein
MERKRVEVVAGGKGNVTALNEAKSGKLGGVIE